LRSCFGLECVRFLVGEGARRWGIAHGIQGILPDPPGRKKEVVNERKRSHSETEHSQDVEEGHADRQENDDPMVSPRSKAAWKKYTKRLRLWKQLSEEEGKEEEERKREQSEEKVQREGIRTTEAEESHKSTDENQPTKGPEETDDQLYDTVGAICIDSAGRTAAGVSRY